MNANHPLEHFRRDTTASETVLRAVERALAGRGVPTRILVPPPRARWAVLRLAGAGALVLSTALALLALLALRPRTPPTLDVHLESSALHHLDVPGDTTLSYHGTGDLSRDGRITSIAWDSGTLRVEVAPGRGHELVVHTREARVRVVGTAFTVTRGSHGTLVEVERGTVEVTCHLAQPVGLVQGEDTTCSPVSAEGLLGRARRVQAAGANPERALLTAEEGLLLTEPLSPTHLELRVVRMMALADLGRVDEAIAAGETILADGGGTRRGQVEGFLVELREEREAELE